MARLEEYSTNKYIEIKGIAVTEHKNLTGLPEKITTTIGKNVQRTDVDVCHGVLTKYKDKSNILVELDRRSKREAVVEKARKIRVSTFHLGGTDSFPVFVIEHLCPRLSEI